MRATSDIARAPPAARRRRSPPASPSRPSLVLRRRRSSDAPVNRRASLAGAGAYPTARAHFMRLAGAGHRSQADQVGPLQRAAANPEGRGRPSRSGARPDLLDRPQRASAGSTPDARTLTSAQWSRRRHHRQRRGAGRADRTAVLPDVNAKELARTPELQEGLRLGEEGQVTPERAAGDIPSRPPRPTGRLVPENKRVYLQRAHRVRRDRFCRQGDNIGIAGAGEISGSTEPDRSARGGLHGFDPDLAQTRDGFRWI